MVFIAVGRAYRLAPRGLKSWPIGLAALTVAEVALITGLTPRLDLKNGYFGTPILGVMIACLICAGLLGSPAITVVRERCAIARRGAGGVGVVARMARRVGAPTATNPGATRACYDLTEPCP